MKEKINKTKEFLPKGLFFPHETVNKHIFLDLSQFTPMSHKAYQFNQGQKKLVCWLSRQKINAKYNAAGRPGFYVFIVRFAIRNNIIFTF